MTDDRQRRSSDAGLTRCTAVQRFRFLGFLRYDNRIAVTLLVYRCGLGAW
jgi:hypothetical protein